jgi:hypothetical protein
MSKVAPAVLHAFVGIVLCLSLPGCSDDETGPSGTGGKATGGAAGSASNAEAGDAGTGAGSTSGSATSGGGGNGAGASSGGAGSGSTEAASFHCDKWFRKCGPKNEIGVEPIVVKNFTAADGCLAYFQESSKECQDCMVLHMMGLEGPGDTSHCYHTAGEGLEPACGCKP